MKRVLIFFLLTIFISSYSHCQNKKVNIVTIESGLNNFDQFRVFLMEKGFILKQKERETEDSNYPEWWEFEKDKEKIDYYLSTHNDSLISISVRISRSLQGLSTEILNMVVKNYPEKILTPIYYQNGDNLVDGGYIIKYKKKGSKVDVSYYSDEKSYTFDFYKHLDRL
jgi:hypothetical protein